MASIEEYLNYTLLRRADVLTKVVEHKKPQSELYDVGFCPMKSYPKTSVELMVKTGYGAGLAQFKADNASTPIAAFEGALQRQVMDLLTIAEKDVMNATDLKRLQSTDTGLAQEAASTLVEKTMGLRHRNINRTRWLAWSAVKGSITVTYPTGSTLTVDYDLDGGAMNAAFSATHVPTAAVSWATASTDIIGDVQTWATRIADDLGCDEKNIALHVPTAVWRHMMNNTAIKAKLSSSMPRIIQPARDEVANLLGIAAVLEVNDFYWDGTTKNRFLPITHVLMTVYEGNKYEYAGVPLAEMYDGPVVRVENGQIQVAPNPGLLAETYVIEDVAALNIRVQSSRIPVINHAAGIIYAQVIV